MSDKCRVTVQWILTLKPTLSFCHQDAFYIQECVPENLELKQKVWRQIDQFVNSEQTILARFTVLLQ